VTARKEVLLLVGIVLAIDLVFIAIYFGARVRYASDSSKLVFTLLWTLAVLLAALRGLSRVRSARLQKPLV
jgi:RsiW-degrading membrane proteinase PrsW (M82 family)